MNPAFILVLVLFLTACANTPTATPLASATRAPQVSATSEPSSVLVDYARSGGFAGLNDHLTIDSSGHATLARGTAARQFDLSGDDLAQLQAVFQSAGFGTLPENSMPRTVPPDAFTYVIIYQGHRVKTADSGVPGPLQPVLEALNRYL